MRNLRSLVITGAVVAGGAGLLFGGSAVSTAWTSSGTAGFTATAASIGTSVSGSVALNNAVPGDESQPQAVKIKNTGSGPSVWAATFSGGDAALNAYTDVYFLNSSGVVISDLGTVAHLEATGAAPQALGTWVGGSSFTAYYALGLASDAPSSLAGHSTAVTYTVTGTAVSDTNQHNEAGFDTNTDAPTP